MSTLELLDVARVKGYHAHVYYDDNSYATAALIREQLSDRFSVKLGRWRDDPVGPHPRAMYQVAFKPDLFAAIVPWLMLNRAGLTVLVHPETGNDFLDHSEHSLWIGKELKLNLDMFTAN